MTIVYGQCGRGHTCTLQRGTGEIGIGRTLELVGTTLRDGVDATTCESALTDVVRGNRNRHLIQGVE